jgi:hypothetical protein
LRFKEKKIFFVGGFSLSSLKGKTKKKLPKPVEPDIPLRVGRLGESLQHLKMANLNKR